MCGMSADIIGKQGESPSRSRHRDALQGAKPGDLPDKASFKDRKLSLTEKSREMAAEREPV